MTLFWSDYKRMKADPYEPPPGLDLVIAAFRPVGRIPVVREYLEETFAGTVGRINGMMELGRYADAYAIAVDGLTRFREPGSSFLYPDGFWFIMRLAVDSLEKLPSSQSRESLIFRARNGPEPFAGYDVAYTFCAFARWRYAEGRYDEGGELAAFASGADATWGAPDILIGRNQLASGWSDGYARFIRAVSKEPEVVHEIVADPIVQNHKDLLGRLEASPEFQAALRTSSAQGSAR